jgi:hypothetical protein
LLAIFINLLNVQTSLLLMSISLIPSLPTISLAPPLNPFFHLSSM